MSDWPHIRLKYVVQINERALPEAAPDDIAFRYIDISACGRGVLTGEPERMQFGMAPSRARRLVQPGDTIVSTVRTYLRAVWPVSGPTDDLLVSTGFAVVTPTDRLDARYLGWLMQSDAVIEEIVARSVGVSYPAINALDIGDIRVPCPRESVQRAIADYLDAETARIDGVVAGRIRQLELVREHHAAFRDGFLSRAASKSRRLSHLLSEPISDGPHETPEFVDDGVPFLSVDNMVNDELSFEGCRRISGEAYSEYSRKSNPRRGDVLVTKAASVGRVALVDTDEPFGVWSPLAILRPNRAAVLPEFLHIALLGAEAQSLMKLAATSNTQENLAMRDLAALRLRIPGLALQIETVEAVRTDADRTSRAASSLTLQKNLVIERRQALITAAVTGQLNIPGVAA